MIGNISSIINDPNLMHVSAGILSTELSTLENFASADKVLSGEKYKELATYIGGITQFRIYCTKPYHNRVVDVTNQINLQGKLWRDYIMDEEQSELWHDTTPSCRDSFYKFDDDNSNLKTQCSKKDRMSGESRLYTYGYYNYYKYYVNLYKYLGRVRLECDDFNWLDTSFDNYGEWKFYVR